MIGRIATYVVLQALAGLGGWTLDRERGALLGVALTGFLWFLFDAFRGARLLAWLRQGECRDPPMRHGLWGEVADRTRRVVRNLNQKTQSSDERLQDFLAAIQASPNGVVLLDAEGRIEWCNETAAGHLGFHAERDREQLIGYLVRDPSFAAYMAAQNFGHEVMIEGRSSTFSRPVRLSLQMHPYGEGRNLLLSRDITALEQAEVMRRDFVANVSHEIRTPLTVLSGFIETLQNLPLDADERERYLAMMALQSQRMQSLVSDLLTLSRLEGSPLPSMQAWTSLPDLMAQCEQEARALSASLTATVGKPHQLSFTPAPHVALAGSPSEWQSAFSNLVSNAVRYTPPGGAISVDWQIQDGGVGDGFGTSSGGVVFSVQDTGPGIAPEHIPRLTERFYRVDRSRSRETGGTGLGLAIVKHVLQRHGAELKISSTPGQGSRFSIGVPGGRVR